MQDKLIELETKFSFQEDMLLELNQVVIRQQKQLDQMLEEVRLLKQQIGEVAVQNSNPDETEPQNELPPHY